MSAGEPAGLGRAAVLVFLALLGATFAAFFVAQRVKQTPTVARAKYPVRAFAPGDRVYPEALLGLELTHPDRVALTIVEARSGRPVRRVARDRPVAGGQTLFFTWDGRDDAGRPAPRGCYAVEAVLPRQERAFTFSRWVALGRPADACVPPPLSS